MFLMGPATSRRMTVVLMFLMDPATAGRMTVVVCFRSPVTLVTLREVAGPRCDHSVTLVTLREVAGPRCDHSVTHPPVILREVAGSRCDHSAIPPSPCTNQTRRVTSYLRAFFMRLSSLGLGKVTLRGDYDDGQFCVDANCFDRWADFG